MKTSAPVLLPLLRSRAQGELMAVLFLHPDREWSLSELAATVKSSVPTVMREVNKLVDAGMLLERRVGRTRTVRVITEGPVYRPLAELLAVTFGPVAVLRELFQDVAGVDEAYIYGSWAARYAEAPGAIPGDIDVLAVGEPSARDLDELTMRAEAALRREVNVRRIQPSTWRSTEPTSFVTTVKSRPLVQVAGDAHE